jgi:regulator of protease activity HflC (stomatin/prohibitin superfamily)
VNYAAEILAARQQRDAAVEAARAEARRLISRASAERDREIRRLRAQDPSLSCNAISSLVGCSPSQVFEVLRPERREAYNRRRRAHWRRRHLKAVG